MLFLNQRIRSGVWVLREEKMVKNDEISKIDLFNVPELSLNCEKW